MSRFPEKSPDSRSNFGFVPKQRLLELSPPVFIAKFVRSKFVYQLPHEKGIISTYEINILLLLESERSPVPFPILHLNLRIKIVRLHFGWCNFKILTVNSIDVICPRSSFAVPATIGSPVFGICPMGHASSSAPSLVLHSKHSETIPQSHKSAFRDGVNSSTIVVSNQSIFAVFSWNGSTFGVAIATSIFNCESNEMIMK